MTAFGPPAPLLPVERAAMEEVLGWEGLRCRMRGGAAGAEEAGGIREVVVLLPLLEEEVGDGACEGAMEDGEGATERSGGGEEKGGGVEPAGGGDGAAYGGGAGEGMTLVGRLAKVRISVAMAKTHVGSSARAKVREATAAVGEIA